MFSEAYFAIKPLKLDTQGTLLGVNEFKEVNRDFLWTSRDAVNLRVTFIIFIPRFYLPPPLVFQILLLRSF